MYGSVFVGEGIHVGFDKILASFFWEGVGEKRK
jgi:hypothetical protein